MTIGWGITGISAQTSHFVKAVARPGDGVHSLLKYYQCHTDCNIDQFYRLNNMGKRQGLKVNQLYTLPIYVYRYNGRSIRSTIGINDRPRAEKILSYNEDMHKAHLQNEDFRKSKVLWVPHHFVACPEEEIAPAVELGYTVPAGPSTATLPLRGTYDIFGEKHAKVPRYSKDLEGHVYYVVAGHGGRDPGAVGSRWGKKICEDEYAYDISLRLAWQLLAHSATVYMIVRDPNDGIRSDEYLPHDEDEICWGGDPIPGTTSEKLFQRSDAVNDQYKKNKWRGVTHQRLIVVHIDSGSKREKMDMYFYHKEGDETGKKFANTIRQTIGKKYAEVRKGRGYNGTVSSRDLHMLRETEPTAVFIELGNIKNKNDQSRFVLASNRQLVANWLAEGIMKDAK